jgi:drug/metabolite transporter (DMT)-like permease
MHPGLAIGAALGSALCFAISSALQQRGAARAPDDCGHRLLLHLVVHPAWLAGFGAAAGTLALQAVALGNAELSLVQPLMLLGLLFALPVSVLLEKRKPSMREWGWAAVLVVGLSVFLLAARPENGPPIPQNHKLLEAGAVALLTIGAVIALGYGPARRHRAALLGLGTGICYGLAAAMMKYCYGIASTRGIVHLLVSWPLYAFAVIGGGGIMLNQAAYRSGPLAGALPPLAIADPLVAIVIGMVAFGEGLRRSPGAVLIQVLGFGILVVAIVALARSSAGRHALDPCAADEDPDRASASERSERSQRSQRSERRVAVR